MSVKVVLLDVYGTLLEVLPIEDPLVRERVWQTWCLRYLGIGSERDHVAVLSGLKEVVTRHQETGRGRGVDSPEVCWPAVVAEVLPFVERLDAPTRALAEAELMAVTRSLRLMPGCAGVLRRWKAHGLRFGILSNAQAYSLGELSAALATEGLSFELFEPRFTFWSFEHGFSKPNPHAYQILTARLASEGVAPAEVLMVGDRMDNDVIPARAFGWRAWHLGAAPDRDWSALGDWMEEERSKS